MKKQIILIHGGDCFNSYDSYLIFLRNREMKIEDLVKTSRWKDTLQSDLGVDYQVLAPRMPNNFNSRYLEWKIWFEKIIPFINDQVLLIGLSLGGMFLAKYLSENIFTKNIKAVVLIAAPYNQDGVEDLADDFLYTKKLTSISDQCQNIYLLNSTDDPVVPFEHVYKFKKDLLRANIIEFKDKGHFRLEKFPELVDLIKKIY